MWRGRDNEVSVDAADFAKILFFLVVIGIVVAVVALRKKRDVRVDAVANASTPLIRMFCERTGYAFPDFRHAPPAAQAQRWEEEYRRAQGNVSSMGRLVRPYQGLEVNWEHESWREAGYRVYKQAWWAPAPWPINAPFHLTDRRTLHPKLAPGQTSSWRPAFDRMVPIGDPELDQRFALFTPVDESRIRAILQNGQLRSALLQCAYVDLQVTPQGARFSDPRDENGTAMLGGVDGLIRYAGFPGKVFELTLPVHERVANILLGGLSLSR